jgi:hypothetical protein
LEFDFAALGEGEIHAIGFANNDTPDQERFFKLYGTQDWGILNFDDYSGINNKRYKIEVGDFFTGNFTRLVMLTDNDGSPSGIDSHFQNIYLYESSECPNGADLVAGNEEILLGGEAESGDGLLLYPNPTSDVLNVSIGYPGYDQYEASVVDLLGRVVWKGTLGNGTSTVKLKGLAQGVYVLVLNADGFQASKKFVKSADEK